MAEPLAVLVEDDPEQAKVSSNIISEAGFLVKTFSSISPALQYLQSTQDPIDLFALDRRLPVNAGEPATDELGDELLKEVRDKFPDARLIVFTGFATIRHVQDSLQGSGQLPTQDEARIDRISVLEKDQSLEFKQHVESFHNLLQTLENIEVRLSDSDQILTELDKRVLRRVAFEYQANSVTATSLTGGLTGAAVWKCQLRTPEGPFVTVIAKETKKGAAPSGLPNMLPPGYATPTVATLSGLIGGRRVSVLQLAGAQPESLMVFVARDPQDAVRHVEPIMEALDAIQDVEQVLSLCDISRPLITWDVLTELLEREGVRVPAGSLMATAKVGMRHCDLHPANFLVDDNHAILIDCDSSEFGTGLIDPITLLLSTLVHPDSPLRGDSWPSVSEIHRAFGKPDFARGHSHEVWFSAVSRWALKRYASEREFWGVTLAYAGRQFRWDTVVGEAAIKDRLLALITKSIDALAAT